MIAAVFGEPVVWRGGVPRSPATEEDDWTDIGGLPRPADAAEAEKAPHKDKAGFWTAMIWPPLAERTLNNI